MALDEAITINDMHKILVNLPLGDFIRKYVNKVTENLDMISSFHRQSKQALDLHLFFFSNQFLIR